MHFGSQLLAVRFQNHLLTVINKIIKYVDGTMQERISCLVARFGFNGPLRQYFSPYRISPRERDRDTERDRERERKRERERERERGGGGGGRREK